MREQSCEQRIRGACGRARIHHYLCDPRKILTTNCGAKHNALFHIVSTTTYDVGPALIPSLSTESCHKGNSAHPGSHGQWCSSWELDPGSLAAELVLSAFVQGSPQCIGLSPVHHMDLSTAWSIHPIVCPLPSPFPCPML